MSKNIDLMMAYSAKRRAKKMAEGGSIKEQKRPMPEQLHDDKVMAKDNSHMKHPHDDKMTSQPERKQTAKGGVYAVKEPKIMPGSTFKSKPRNSMDMMEHDEERDMMESMKPASPMEEPKHEMDEMEPKREGPSVHKMPMMAEGGMAEADDVDEEELEHASSLAAAIMAKRKFAKGGEVDLDMNAEEEPNNEDDMSFEALKKENYDEDDALSDIHEPMDSNEHSPEHDEEDVDDKSIVSKIMKKRRKSPISE